jgi:hypothetical protein
MLITLFLSVEGKGFLSLNLLSRLLTIGATTVSHEFDLCKLKLYSNLTNEPRL